MGAPRQQSQNTQRNAGICAHIQGTPTCPSGPLPARPTLCTCILERPRTPPPCAHATHLSHVPRVTCRMPTYPPRDAASVVLLGTGGQKSCRPSAGTAPCHVYNRSQDRHTCCTLALSRKASYVYKSLATCGMGTPRQHTGCILATGARSVSTVLGLHLPDLEHT